MEPFFTVIVCTYNRASLLPRALDSLQAQSEGSWEAIIVDDGSTDATFDVVQRYAVVDPRITLVAQGSNRGVSAARNVGIGRSAGRYVTFLDSDDEYAGYHLEHRRGLLSERPAIQLLHGGVRVIGDPYVIDRHDPSRKIHVDDCIVGGTFFIRRDVFGIVGTFDAVAYADDSMFYDRCTAAGIFIATAEAPSYLYYRNVPDQMTSTHGT